MGFWDVDHRTYASRRRPTSTRCSWSRAPPITLETSARAHARPAAGRSASARRTGRRSSRPRTTWSSCSTPTPTSPTSRSRATSSASPGWSSPADPDDVAGLCTDLHAVNTALEEQGFGPGLLCSLVPFADRTAGGSASSTSTSRAPSTAFAPTGPEGPRQPARDPGARHAEGGAPDGAGPRPLARRLGRPRPLTATWHLSTPKRITGVAYVTPRSASYGVDHPGRVVRRRATWSQRSVAVGAAREVEHPLQRDLGPLLGLGVDLDPVDDHARRPATRAPTPGGGGRSGSSSSSSRRCGRGRRCPARGARGASRCTRLSSVPIAQLEPGGAASMVLMMNSVEPTRSALRHDLVACTPGARGS